MRRRRSEPSSRAGAPAWMVTYGDAVTLLLAFFVLLFTFSTIDLQRFQQIMSAFQGSISVLDGGRTVTTDQSLETQMSELDLEQLQRLHAELQEFLEVEGLTGSVEVHLEERGVTVRFADQLFFDLGQAVLKPEAVGVLESLSPILRDIPNPIRIEGHTDDLPIQTAQFPSNWELSTRRATSVIRHLVENHGFSPQRLSAAGYGEHRPLTENDTAEKRAQNRRVDIVIMALGEWVFEP